MISKFIRHLRVERGLSPCTCSSYDYQLRAYHRFLDAKGENLLTVTRETLLAYLEARRNAGLAGSSIFAAAVAIRQYHRFLTCHGYSLSDPTAGMVLPKFKQRLPEPLSIQDLGTILDMPVGLKFQQVRNKAMLELLYATGMRVSELLGLTMPMVDLSGYQVRVCGKGGKERIVPFGQKAGEALSAYMAERETRFPQVQSVLFVTAGGKPVKRGAFWWELRHMAKQAGFKGRISPHQIRHSAATHMLEGGADLRVIQEVLGHSSITTTQRYAHVTARLLKATCQRAHPRF
ncbi:MAG: hypothetical protein A2218_10430 [Elusimicrobia bacterium RIFOXYA2_FULL_53_38]|nr:MAG: hypothetical protein A2218_10430 [Elusimicrobia bacterium RIFOXYA2_FULL_53_38]